MKFGIEILDGKIPWDDAGRRRLRGRNILIGNRYWSIIRKGEELLANLFRASLRRGVVAAKRTGVPAVFVQGFMLALVVGYYRVPPVTGAFSHLAEFKRESGLVFSFLSMGLTSIFAEFLRIFFAGEKPGRSFFVSAGFGFLVFGGLGVFTDCFNHFQRWIWMGLPPKPQLIAKVLTDQFLWTVIFANPYQTLLFVWKDAGFNPRRFHDRITPFRRFYAGEMFAVLVTNWAFWIPTVAIVYSLPADLQFIMLSLAVAIWVLLLSALTEREPE